MTNFNDYLAEQMKNPDFKREYDALTPEFDAIRAEMDAQDAAEEKARARAATHRSPSPIRPAASATV